MKGGTLLTFKSKYWVDLTVWGKDKVRRRGSGFCPVMSGNGGCSVLTLKSHLDLIFVLVSKDRPSGEDGGSTPWPPAPDSTSK